LAKRFVGNEWDSVEVALDGAGVLRLTRTSTAARGRDGSAIRPANAKRPSGTCLSQHLREESDEIQTQARLELSNGTDGCPRKWNIPAHHRV